MSVLDNADHSAAIDCCRISHRPDVEHLPVSGVVQPLEYQGRAEYTVISHFCAHEALRWPSGQELQNSAATGRYFLG
jgi:hypothetical protein